MFWSLSDLDAFRRSVLELRGRVAESESKAAQHLQEQEQSMKRWKSILICYFPREACGDRLSTASSVQHMTST